MIAALLAATISISLDEVLARYASALATHRTPLVETFEYTLDQTGLHNGEQVHRVFRSGDDERDELLVRDGERLDLPSVHIYHRRKNRYTLERLAPQPDVYSFSFVGTQRDGTHLDYVFSTANHAENGFRVTRVTIDGLTFLPLSIAFVTDTNAGGGSVNFGAVDGVWVVTGVDAHAKLGTGLATEHLTFSGYTFPATLPDSTF